MNTVRLVVATIAWFGPGMVALGDLTCVEEAHLTASLPVANELFGRSVCIDGDYAIIGAAPNDAGSLTNPGSAYIFIRNASTWMQQAHLMGSEAVAGDDMGHSVSIDGDTALVGVPYDDVGLLSDAGSTYVFVRIGSAWIQQAHLVASDPSEDDLFGKSVSIVGDTAFIGAPYHDVGTVSDAGTTYVFVRTGKAWTEQQQLTASDAAEGDHFGFSVFMDGDTAVIGARLDDVGSILGAGSAYIFVREGDSWTQQAHLTASDPGEYDRFGENLSLDGDTAVIGAFNDDLGDDTIGYFPDAGSAYVFVRNGSSWMQQAHLLNPNPNFFWGSRSFGYSVSIVGDIAVISAPGGGVYGPPSMYSYFRCAGVWNQLVHNNVHGSSVSYDGDTVLVGDTLGSGILSLAGSAHVFDCPDGPSCPEDLFDDGQVNSTDLAIVLAYWGAFEPFADISCDGLVDGIDLAMLLGAWGPCEG